MHRCLSGDPAWPRPTTSRPPRPRRPARPGARPPRPAASGAARPTGPWTWSARMATSSAEVAVHGMRLPLGALLVVRAFELWIHDNDIRRVAGLPASVPDASTLRLMTELAARMLPYGATLTGLREPVSLHLVLTGPGGGTWDVPVGKRRARSGPGQHRHRRRRVLPAGGQPGRRRRSGPARHRRPRPAPPRCWPRPRRWRSTERAALKQEPPATAASRAG